MSSFAAKMGKVHKRYQPNEVNEVDDSGRDDVMLFYEFLHGRDEAFRYLFRRHNQRLFRYCLKLVGMQEQAEDLTQEIWRKVIELRGKQTEVYNPLGFLYKVARNLCLDYLKSRKYNQRLDDLKEGSHPSTFIHEPSEREEVVLTALQELSPKYRDVLVLQMYCGYRLEEIAGMLGTSPEAIWTRASRARAKLRSIVAKRIAATATPDVRRAEDAL